MHRLWIVALLAAVAAAAAPAAADEFVFGGNSGALARSFALPTLGAWRVAAQGQAHSRVSFDVVNEYVSEGNCAVECITLDGETQRLVTDYRVGLGGGWDLSLRVPLLDRDGGFLDGWIEQWHGWFGLPNGGREAAARDQFRYRYERAGAVLLDETAGDTGLGDVSLGLGLALGDGAALRALVKLPTGDGPALSGGNTGGAAWLDLALPVPAGWDGYFSAGYSRNERGDVLTALQNQEVLFGGIGLLAPITREVRLLMQLNANGRLYEGGELSPLARHGLPLTLGLQFRTSRQGRFDIGFQEDPSVNGSPDFAFYVSLASLPRR